jgi:hypothetical protein
MLYIAFGLGLTALMDLLSPFIGNAPSVIGIWLNLMVFFGASTLFVANWRARN